MGTLNSRANLRALTEETRNKVGGSTACDLKALARSLTREAVEVLAEVMRSQKFNAGARVTAAVALLDRGWGKPTQTVYATHTKVNLNELSDDELIAIASGHGAGGAAAAATPPGKKDPDPVH